jgi:hypothetical protein
LKRRAPPRQWTQPGISGWPRPCSRTARPRKCEPLHDSIPINCTCKFAVQANNCRREHLFADHRPSNPSPPDGKLSYPNRCRVREVSWNASWPRTLHSKVSAADHPINCLESLNHPKLSRLYNQTIRAVPSTQARTPEKSDKNRCQPRSRAPIRMRSLFCEPSPQSGSKGEQRGCTPHE